MPPAPEEIDESHRSYVDPWPAFTGERPPDGADGKALPSDDLCAWVRERSEHVLVGLSFGKDSLATFQQLTRFWPKDKIIGFHLFVVPGLAFQRRTLAYYREALGITIVHLPHRSCYRMINNAVFAPPSHRPVIIGTAFPDVEYPDLYATVAAAADIDYDMTWVAQGVRSADSPMRRVVITQHGPFNLRTRTFYPVHDWRKRDVLAALDTLGLPLPVDYQLWGRTFDGLDYRFVAALAETFPEDYARLRRFAPLVGAEWVRRGLRPPEETDE